MASGTFNGLKFRSIGPAFTSGRVIGFAVDPNNAARYFVASASGGEICVCDLTPAFELSGPTDTEPRVISIR